MNLKQLFEELAGEVNSYGIKVNVYKNPQSEEMKTLIKLSREHYDELRFVIDRRKGKKDVYIWPASVMHKMAAKKFQLPYPHKEMLYGIARVLDNGKLEANSSYTSNKLKSDYDYYHKKIKEVPKDHDIYAETALEHKISKADYKKHISRNWKNKWIDVTELLERMNSMTKDTFYRENPDEEEYDHDA